MKILSNQQLREDFPILSKKIHGHPFVYLDNASTSQKPRAVMDTLKRYYQENNSNIHRGIHHTSEQATLQYEEARHKVARLINANHESEIIFVRGTTEAINLIAQTYGRANIQSGDEIIISEMEHHSNIVPWQLLCEEKNIQLKIAPINESGEIILEKYQELLTPKTKLVAITHISNALGSINPLSVMIKMAHEVGAVVVVDGAQAVPHMKINVQALGCDFYAFSGHKMYAPTGVGVLYGKKALLESMPPYHGGGNMIRTVSLIEKTTFNELPYKFEAGTPNIAGVIALGTAIDYISGIDISTIEDYETTLLNYATERLQEIPELHLIGTAKEKASILSFTLDHAHPHDIGTILDQQGIAVRAGHHCAMPIMEKYKIPGTVRASFCFYNTVDEVDILFNAIQKVREIFR